MKNLVVIFITCLFICTAGISKASIVYSNDFENAASGEIQNGQLMASSEGSSNNVFGNYYLGVPHAANSNPITLELSQLPLHSYLEIEFDLALISSSEGQNNSSFNSGLNYVNINVIIDDPVFAQSFGASYNGNQYGKGYHPILWGQTFTTGDNNDSVHHISILVPHDSENSRIRWFATGDQGETLTLDNIQVSAFTVPLPSAFFLLGSSLFCLLGIRRRREN